MSISIPIKQLACERFFHFHPQFPDLSQINRQSVPLKQHNNGVQIESD